MEISITKKLANAIGIKPDVPSSNNNPLFSWTANWTNTFYGRKEDMVVLVNNANRFTVTIFGVKKNQFKNIDDIIITAIRNTLLTMKINPEIVEEYLNQAGEIVYASNHDRKLTADLNSQCFNSALIIADAYSDSCGTLKFDDTMGYITSNLLILSDSKSFVPAKEMVKDLAKLTNKPAYNYRAFELLITLDLEIYKATRRIIIDADMDFGTLHRLLQTLFEWENFHLYNFVVFNNKTRIATLIPYEDDLLFDEKTLHMEGKKLSDYFPKYNRIVYTYDMGDYWEHEIKLIRVIENHDENSPFLLEAIGQTPPDDVGGIPGFINFRNIMLNPKHPDYEDMCSWVGYWNLELSNYEKRPRVISNF